MWTIMSRAWTVALLASLAAVIGCGVIRPPRPPNPNPQPPPTVRVAMTVLTEDRTAVPGLTCVLLPDNAPAAACDYSSGIQTVWSVPSSVEHQGAEVKLSADGYLPVNQRVVIEHELGETTMVVPVVNLPRLVPVGEYFQMEGGQRITVIGASDFNLLGRYWAGEDIEPVLNQRHDLGFNVLRVWTAFDVCANGIGCQQIGHLTPTGSMYAAIPAFAKYLAKHGLWVEFTAFTGPYGSTLPNDDAKVAHWEAMISAVDGLTNVMLEMVNEYDHPANNDIPFNRLRRPQDSILSSHGSGTQDAMPPQPFWRYVTYHPGGGGEWQRKVGHNAWEDVSSWSGLPTVSNEITRSPDSDGNSNHFYDAAAGAALMNAGATFHSVHGKNSTLFEGAELNNAQAFVAGVRSVPTLCQGQPYRNLTDPNDRTYLRVYQRGGDPACIVRIRP